MDYPSHPTHRYLVLCVTVLTLAFTLLACAEQGAESRPFDQPDLTRDDPVRDLAEQSQPDSFDTSEVSPPQDTSSEQDADEPDIPELTGTYAMLNVMSAIAQVPMVGEVYNDNVALLRVEVSQVGLQLELRSEICGLEMESSTQVVQTVFPDAFIRSLPTTVRSARLELAEGGGVVFEAPWFIDLRGVILTDPENDPLPTQADDPRVWDQDGDGQPGLTVRITGLINGDIYLIQRAADTYLGLVENDGTISGRVSWDDEQVILGSDHALLRTGLEAYPNPDPNSSYFSYIPIDESWSCADVLAHSDELFPR